MTFFNLFVLFTINDTTKKSLHRAEASSKHKSSFLLYKGKPDNYILRWCLTAHKYKKCLNRCLNPKGKGWQGVDFSRCIKCFHVTSQSHCAWFIEQCLERKNKPFSKNTMSKSLMKGFKVQFLVLTHKSFSEEILYHICSIDESETQGKAQMKYV